MKKDKEWLKGLINEEGIVMDMHLLGRIDEQYWKNENIKINKGRLFYLIDQLDGTEVLTQDWIDGKKMWVRNKIPFHMDVDYAVPADDLQNLIVPKLEVLSQEWISKHSNGPSRSQYVWVDDLKELLVPKQEEVDQAYKDGYEKGKQHTFYKGYLEGLTDKESEPETVADVIADFYKSLERLKEVLGTEVKELEE